MPKLEEFIVPRVFALMTDHEGEGSGVENKLKLRAPKSWPKSCTFRGKKGMASRNRGKMSFWSNDVNRPLVGENYLVRVRKQKNLKGNERGTARLR